MNDPLISIVIPVYNVEKYLRGCLDSVLAQTYGNWEAICVNDGSTDGSAEILHAYAAKDLRFKVIEQKHENVSNARNNGLARAAGKYVYFMDSDDFISPYAMETVRKIIEEKNPDCVCFDYLVAGDGFVFSQPDKPRIKTINTPFAEFIKRKSIFSQNIWTKVFRKDCIKNIKFEPEMVQGQDLYFNILAFRTLNSAIFVKEKMYCYVMRSSSTTHQNFSTKKALGFLLMNKKLFEQFGQESFFAQIRQNISNLNLKFVLKKLGKSDNLDAEVEKYIAVLAQCGAVGYKNLPLKMKIYLWCINRRHKNAKISG